MQIEYYWQSDFFKGHRRSEKTKGPLRAYWDISIIWTIWYGLDSFTPYVGLIPLKSQLLRIWSDENDEFFSALLRNTDSVKMTLMLKSLSIIYSQKNEPNWTDVTECFRIVLITSINRGFHIIRCVRGITAEGFAVEKIFFHEYRNLTWILTKLTSLYHHSYPTAGITTWKWDFITVSLKNSLRSI